MQLTDLLAKDPTRRPIIIVNGRAVRYRVGEITPTGQTEEGAEGVFTFTLFFHLELRCYAHIIRSWQVIGAIQATRRPRSGRPVVIVERALEEPVTVDTEALRLMQRGYCWFGQYAGTTAAKRKRHHHG